MSHYRLASSPGGLGYCEDGISLCARGAQQQAGQQVADKKKTELAVLLGIHVPDYKQIFRDPQVPASSNGIGG